MKKIIKILSCALLVQCVDAGPVPSPAPLERKNSITPNVGQLSDAKGRIDVDRIVNNLVDARIFAERMAETFHAQPDQHNSRQERIFKNFADKIQGLVMEAQALYMLDPYQERVDYPGGVGAIDPNSQQYRDNVNAVSKPGGTNASWNPDKQK